MPCDRCREGLATHGATDRPGLGRGTGPAQASGAHGSGGRGRGPRAGRRSVVPPKRWRGKRRWDAHCIDRSNAHRRCTTGIAACGRDFGCWRVGCYAAATRTWRDVNGRRRRCPADAWHLTWQPGARSARSYTGTAAHGGRAIADVSTYDHADCDPDGIAATDGAANPDRSASGADTNSNDGTQPDTRTDADTCAIADPDDRSELPDRSQPGRVDRRASPFRLERRRFQRVLHSCSRPEQQGRADAEQDVGLLHAGRHEHRRDVRLSQAVSPDEWQIMAAPVEAWRWPAFSARAC